MATLSLTFSQFGISAKQVHTGVIAAGGALSVSNTVCPSTILHMVQVPGRCTLLDYWIRIQTGGADQTFQIGTSQTTSGIMSLTTLCQTYCLSTQNITPAGAGLYNQGIYRGGGTTGLKTAVTDLMPVQISISDDSIPSRIWVQGRVGVACSASAFFTFMLFYTCDGLTGHTVIR